MSHPGSENIMVQQRVFGARVLLLSAETFFGIKAATDHLPRMPPFLTQEGRQSIRQKERAMLAEHSATQYIASIGHCMTMSKSSYLELLEHEKGKRADRASSDSLSFVHVEHQSDSLLCPAMLLAREDRGKTIRKVEVPQIFVLK